MAKTARAMALVGALALALAGCGSQPSSTGTSSPATGAGTTAATTTSAPASNFHACMVSDSGGIDDRAFNATAWKGMQDAQKSLGVKVDFLESKSNADYVPNIQKWVQADCGIIVTVGFLLGDATKEAAAANPSKKFAIVDFAYPEPIANVKPLIFDTAQAAFQAGYLAAAMTKSGTVATYGGIKIPTVTIFMDGFWEGVQYYNSQKGKNVKVIGWDEKTQNGSFTGDFEDQNKGRQFTNNFIQQGADIILPVAGPVGLGTAAAAKATNGRVNVIWVDTDGCVSAQQYCSLFLTSVVKGIDVAVTDVVKAASDGSFSGDPFVGTLDNKGVSIAPFHEFDSKVPAEVKSELETIKADIVSGKIKITSPSSPK